MAAVGADCHFFYSFTCRKGFWCPFRHVDAARGHGVPCRLWSAGACFTANCRFRHPPHRQMNPSQAPPCRWETRPGGCTKPHCAFRHSRRRGSGSETLPMAAENRVWKRSGAAESNSTQPRPVAESKGETIRVGKRTASMEPHLDEARPGKVLKRQTKDSAGCSPSSSSSSSPLLSPSPVNQCFTANSRFRHPPHRQMNPSQAPPCRWETRPGGCTKPYCAFRHSRRRGFSSALSRVWKRSGAADSNNTQPRPMAESKDETIRVETVLKRQAKDSAGCSSSSPSSSPSSPPSPVNQSGTLPDYPTPVSSASSSLGKSSSSDAADVLDLMEDFLLSGEGTATSYSNDLDDILTDPDILLE